MNSEKNCFTIFEKKQTSILGIDWGEKEIGLAISIEGIAIALETLKNDNTVFDKFKKILQENKIKKIILGLPLTLENKEGSKAKEVKKFGSILKEKFSLSVEFVDERMTTKQIENIFGSKIKEIHQKSAQIILQTYLDLSEFKT